MSMVKLWITQTRLLGLVLAISVGLLSAADAQDFRFTRFEIEGNQRIEDATILSFLGVIPGEPVTAAQVNDGFQRLLASNLFETAEIVPAGNTCLLYTSPSPRDLSTSRMPSSA